MTTGGIPWYIDQDARHSPKTARFQAWMAARGQQGVISPSSCKVSALGTPGAFVTVDPGGFVINNRATAASFEAYPEQVRFPAHVGRHPDPGRVPHRCGVPAHREPVRGRRGHRVVADPDRPGQRPLLAGAGYRGCDPGEHSPTSRRGRRTGRRSPWPGSAHQLVDRAGRGHHRPAFPGGPVRAADRGRHSGRAAADRRAVRLKLDPLPGRRHPALHHDRLDGLAADSELRGAILSGPRGRHLAPSTRKPTTTCTGSPVPVGPGMANVTPSITLDETSSSAPGPARSSSRSRSAAPGPSRRRSGAPCSTWQLQCHFLDPANHHGYLSTRTGIYLNVILNFKRFPYEAGAVMAPVAVT